MKALCVESGFTPINWKEDSYNDSKLTLSKVETQFYKVQNRCRSPIANLVGIKRRDSDNMLVHNAPINGDLSKLGKRFLTYFYMMVQKMAGMANANIPMPDIFESLYYILEEIQRVYIKMKKTENSNES